MEIFVWESWLMVLYRFLFLANFKLLFAHLRSSSSDGRQHGVYDQKVVFGLWCLAFLFVFCLFLYTCPENVKMRAF